MPDQSADKLAAYSAVRGLKGAAVILPDDDELLDRMCEDLITRAFTARRERGVFHVALSGGSTPIPFFRRLVIDPRYRVMPWASTHIWIVDERCVPFDDAGSNYRMLSEHLIQHVTTPAEQVHPMPALETAGDRMYEIALREAMPPDADQPPRLDYVLLGMGADAHTASLFPGTPALREQRRWIVFNDGESVAQPRPRMTMTYHLLNAARTLTVMVTGESKHATLSAVADVSLSHSEDDVQRLPITGIKPAHPDGELIWYLDEAAAMGTRADPRK